MSGSPPTSELHADIAPSTPRGAAPRSTGLGASLIRSGWPPAVLALVLVSAVLLLAGVRARDLAVFEVYALLGLALPGTLLWRMLVSRGSRPFVADVVFGTSLAYAVELGVYVLCRAADLPHLAMWWPLLVVAISLHPRMRQRAWRPHVRRQPVSWSWAMAGMVLVALAWVAREMWRPNPLTPQALRWQYVDLPYQLALITALRRAVPAQLPFVRGEPLDYHWFVHADLAASSWATGIDPVVLLQRLGEVPMIVVTILGASLLAGRLARSRAAALLAPALLTVIGAVTVTRQYSSPYVDALLYLSPTTTFASVLLVAALAALIPLLDRRARVPLGTWLAAVAALAALSGAKGTVLPELIVGFGGVLLMSLLLRRRVHLRAAALLVVSIVFLELARRFVYGDSMGALTWGPLGIAKATAYRSGLSATSTDATLKVTLLVGVAVVVTQLAFAAGMAGLATRGAWRRPSVQLLVFVSAAGAGAAFALSHPSLSQMYFLRTATLPIAVASAVGLVAASRWTRTRAVRVAVPVALLAGGAISLVVDATSPHLSGSPDGTLAEVVMPLALTAAAVLVVGVVAVVLGLVRPTLRRLVLPVVLATILGLGLPFGIGLAADTVQHPVPAGFKPKGRPAIGRGGIEAARWLRAHSSPTDLVATNGHCRNQARTQCDARMFWLGAFAERQVLIEGWSYSAKNLARAKVGESAYTLPFWDPHLLQVNDAAFTHPTAATVHRLSAAYGVRWLVLDRRFRSEPAVLARYASREYHNGAYTIYRVR